MGRAFLASFLSAHKLPPTPSTRPKAWKARATGRAPSALQGTLLVALLLLVVDPRPRPACLLHERSSPWLHPSALAVTTRASSDWHARSPPRPVSPCRAPSACLTPDRPACPPCTALGLAGGAVELWPCWTQKLALAPSCSILSAPFSTWLLIRMTPEIPAMPGLIKTSRALHKALP